VKAPATSRKGGLLQREGDHPWRRKLSATFQHPLSPVRHSDKIGGHKGGVWTKSRGLSRPTRSRLCTRRNFVGFLTRTNETELRFRSGGAHRPMKQGNGAPDTIRTCGLPSEGDALIPAELRVLTAYAALTRISRMSEPQRAVLASHAVQYSSSSLFAPAGLTHAFGGQAPTTLLSTSAGN